MKTKIRIIANDPNEQQIADQLATCVNAIRQEKLKIARLAYKEIIAAIKKWEEYSGQEIRCNWDEYITVDGEGFGYYELVGDDD